MFALYLSCGRKFLTASPFEAIRLGRKHQGGRSGRWDLPGSWTVRTACDVGFLVCASDDSREEQRARARLYRHGVPA